MLPLSETWLHCETEQEVKARGSLPIDCPTVSGCAWIYILHMYPAHAGASIYVLDSTVDATHAGTPSEYLATHGAYRMLRGVVGLANGVLDSEPTATGSGCWN